MTSSRVHPSLRREQRILLIAGCDFDELIFHQGLAHTGVLFFRLPGTPLQIKIEHLDAMLEKHAAELDHGEFLVVTPGQIRIVSRSAPNA